MQTNSRLEYIDISKGLLMVFVILGHIISAFNVSEFVYIRRWIYTFHIPAFFMITGYLYNDSKWNSLSSKAFIIKHFKTLIIPYFFLDIFSGVIQMLLFGTNFVNSKGIIMNTITMHCNSGANWFLPTLFIGEIIFYLIEKINKKWIAYIFCMISIICLFLTIQNHYIILLLRCIVAYLFIFIGYKLKTILNKFNIVVFEVTICITLLSVFNGEVDTYSFLFGKVPIIFLLSSVCGFYMVLHISKKLSSSVIKWIGNNTVVIMGTHQIILSYVKFTLSLTNSIVSSIVSIILISIISYVGCTIFNKFTPTLIGKSVKN